MASLLTNSTLAFLGNIGHMEIILILVVALLLFGKRLPEVGRSVGKAIVEFKRGVKGIEDEIHNESARPPAPQQRSIEADNRAVSQGSVADESKVEAKPNAAH